MKKIVILECLLLLYTTVNHFLDCDVQRKVDFIWQPETTSSSVIRRNSKALPKAKLAPKKSWSLSGGLLLVWSTTAFWTPVKPLHMRSMLSKSMRCTENRNACSWHWSTECRAHNQWFKNWMNWAKKFCLICHIHLTACQPTTTSSSYLYNFSAGKTLSQPEGSRKCLSNPEAWICML